MEEEGIALIYDSKNGGYYPFVNMNTEIAWSTNTNAETNCETCLSSSEQTVTFNNCGCTDSGADNFDS